MFILFFTIISNDGHRVTSVNQHEEPVIAQRRNARLLTPATANDNIEQDVAKFDEKEWYC